MSEREKIIDRIKKLKAHAESAEKIGSEAEAQAFAAAMQRMMSEHKVLMSEVEHARLDETDPVELVRSSGRASNDPSRPERVFLHNRCEWMERLAAVVAKAHYCRMIVTSGCAVITFAGRRTDAAAAVETFEYMVDCATALGRVAYFRAYQQFKRDGGPWQRGFYRSYLLGFSTRLGERYEEEMARMKAEWASAGTALVRLTDALAPVNKFIAERSGAGKQFHRAAAVGVGVQNLGAFHEGRRAADSIKLREEAKQIK